MKNMLLILLLMIFLNACGGGGSPDDPNSVLSLKPIIHLKKSEYIDNTLHVYFDISNILKLEKTLKYPFNLFVFNKSGYNFKKITMYNKETPLYFSYKENKDLEFKISIEKMSFISRQSNNIVYEELACDFLQTNIFINRNKFNLTNKVLEMETDIDEPASYNLVQTFDMYLSFSTPSNKFYFYDGLLVDQQAAYASNLLGSNITTMSRPKIVYNFNESSLSGKYIIEHWVVDSISKNVIFKKIKEVVFSKEYSKREEYRESISKKLEKSITDDEIIENLAKSLSQDGSKLFVSSYKAASFLKDAYEIITYHKELKNNKKYTKKDREKLVIVKVIETILLDLPLNIGLTETVQGAVDHLINGSIKIGSYSGFQAKLNFKHSESGFDRAERELEVTIIPVVQFATPVHTNALSYPNTEPVTNGGEFKVGSKGSYTVGNIPRSGIYTIYAKDSIDKYTRKKTIAMLRGTSYQIDFDYKEKLDREYMEVFNDGTEEEEETGGCITIEGSEETGTTGSGT